MNRIQFLLGKLAEEAVEIAKIALKCQQFGLLEIMEGQPLTNATRTHLELDDLVAVVRLLNKETDFDYMPNEQNIETKINKIAKFAEKSRTLKQLD